MPPRRVASPQSLLQFFWILAECPRAARVGGKIGFGFGCAVGESAMKLRFGDVLFDGDAREVVRGDVAVNLRPKAFDMLQLLIDKRQRAVSKRELLEQLWPGTFVSEANLPSLVAEIREALQDSASDPRYIVTRHGFGYAFRAAVTVVADDHLGEPTCWLAGADGRLSLAQGENVIGRIGPGLILDSPTVSRRHVRIVVTQSAATIEDLGSKNGTFVNDEAVAGARSLMDGDRIRVGSFLMTFRVARPTVDTSSVRPSS